MLIFLRSCLILLIAVALPASGQVESVFKGTESGTWFIDLLFGIIFALIALTWRTHKSEYAEYKRIKEAQLVELSTKVENALKREDFYRMQESINSSIHDLKTDIGRWRETDAVATRNLFGEVQKDIEGQREDYRRISDEVWKQIESHRDRLGQYELILARSYHTKEEIERLLDVKIAPVLSAIRSIPHNR